NPSSQAFQPDVTSLVPPRIRLPSRFACRAAPSLALSGSKARPTQHFIGRRNALVNLFAGVGRRDVPQAAADEANAAILHRRDEPGVSRFVISQGVPEIADFGERRKAG